MVGQFTYIIKPKAALITLVENSDPINSYRKNDVIFTFNYGGKSLIRLSDFVEEVKGLFLKYVGEDFVNLDQAKGFDFYWSIEPSESRVVDLEEVLHVLNLTSPDTGNPVLDLMIFRNTDLDRFY